MVKKKPEKPTKPEPKAAKATKPAAQPPRAGGAQAPAAQVEGEEPKEPAQMTSEEFDYAFKHGLLEVRIKPPDIADTFTRENLEKFFAGEITWGKLMGITLEQAYALAELGYGFYEQGRYHDAKTMFEGLVIANPYDPYFHNMLGAVYQQLDMKDEALEQYNLAIELDPEQLHAHINRGEILLHNGQLEAAARDLERAVELGKDRTDEQVNRARALAFATRHMVNAMQAAKKAPK